MKHSANQTTGGESPIPIRRGFLPYFLPLQAHLKNIRYALLALVVVLGLEPQSAGVIGAGYEPWALGTKTSRPAALRPISKPLVLAAPIESLKTSTVLNIHPAILTLTVPKTRKAWVTAYSSSPDETDDTPHITASGTTVRYGIVATNFLPFGTQIKIPAIFGDEIFVVEDRMHERKVNGVDVWLPEKKLALRFGASYTEIVILD